MKLEARLERPDEFYEALIEAHRGLSAQQSADVNARLILLLANQVGDLATLLAVIAKAREGFVSEGEDATMTAAN